MRQVENIKIGISGIRGVVGETLHPEIILNFTHAFAAMIGKGTVAVAKDSRRSGEYIKRSVFAALMYAHITPVDAGTIPTPTLQILVKTRKLNGGIIITASHNPEEWNGLKFVDENGFFLSQYKASHLIDIYHQRSYLSPQRNVFPSVRSEQRAFDLHRERVFQTVDVESIRACSFRVLADPGGGAGCAFDREFLEGLGCRVTLINDTVKSRFPRHPECLPEHLSEASAIMRAGDFDIGFAQDSDGDRLVILDERGHPVSGDYALTLALDGYLEARPPGSVVVNFSTSRIVEDITRRHHCEVVRAPVGEINVVEKMVEVGALAGGEGNGGVIIPAVHHCRDSFTAMALSLECLARRRKKVSAILDGYPRYEMIKTKVSCSMRQANRVLSLLRDDYPQADTSDGLRVEQGNVWFHVRPSNTEPIMRIIVEGPKKSAQRVADQLRKKIASGLDT